MEEIFTLEKRNFEILAYRILYVVVFCLFKCPKQKFDGCSVLTLGTLNTEKISERNFLHTFQKNAF